MKLGILGGTNLAKSLGKKYIEAGLTVVFGVCPDFNVDEAEWKVLNRFYDRLCPYASAIIQAEIILICCENEHLRKICQALKETDLDDKIIIDCTNSNYDNKLSNCNTLLIRRSAPKAVIFKAFNNLGLDYPNSDVLGIVKETYFCGDANLEKIRVKRLIELIGFKAIDAGKMTNATLLEAFYHLSKEITWNKKEESNYHFKLISV
ncbi:NAD(P)-binding domain-containing protein [Algoriphagus sp. D3-2-R+10]|uniref:NADPH-dependent F420 reductase n=1 Tax=Algoriphagus aurantiacus TaxID=3103948 RepID=UPI002B3B1A5D|nr:NAD(P)-binding domain-containing protein [Algoriphagus sp. D3-2-R+10]MEB2775884.1 NAD(P)-binding domain-containing protein [Algoriphagus sp. D3-2-R+10]